MEVFILKVYILNKKFQRLCHVQPDLDILFVKVTAQIGNRLHYKNTLCTFSSKSNFFCNTIVLPSCNSDSWRRYTLKCFCWCVYGMVGELVQPGGASENYLEVCFVGLVAGGNYVWCLVIVVGGSKRWEKLWCHHLGWQSKLQGGTIFMGKREFSLLLFWNFIVSLTGYCKLFYRIIIYYFTSSIPYNNAVLPVLYLLRLARPKVS